MLFDDLPIVRQHHTNRIFTEGSGTKKVKLRSSLSKWPNGEPRLIKRCFVMLHCALKQYVCTYTYRNIFRARKANCWPSPRPPFLQIHSPVLSSLFCSDRLLQALSFLSPLSSSPGDHTDIPFLIAFLQSSFYTSPHLWQAFPGHMQGMPVERVA